MGASFSKTVKVDMKNNPIIQRRHDRYKHRRHRRRPIKHPYRKVSFSQLQRSSGDISKKNSDSLNDGDRMSTGSKSHNSKRLQIAPPPSKQISSNGSFRVDLEEDESDYRKLGYKASFYNKPRRAIENLVEKFNREFEDLETHLAKFHEKDETNREKLRKFVVAWKTALSYPHIKERIAHTGIPIAATSFCQQGISWCKRLHRSFLRCSSAAAAEHYLEDLLHKDSLDRFLYDAEAHQLTSEIIIRQDLMRTKLFESVRHPEEDEGEEVVVRGDEEDLTLEVKFQVPIPVHIVHPPPDALIHLPPPEKIHQRYEEHQIQLHDKLEHQEIPKPAISEKWIEAQSEHHHHHHDDQVDDPENKLQHGEHHHHHHHHHHHQDPNKPGHHHGHHHRDPPHDAGPTDKNNESLPDSNKK